MNVYTTADRGLSYANVADNYFGGARSYKDRAAQECAKVATSGHPNVPKLLRHFLSCLMYSFRERNNFEE